MSLVESPADERASGEHVRFAEARDYLALLKPRVMSLVVFTALVGLVVAPGRLHPVLALADLICIAVGAGAAGALNMWYEADIDRLMRRTRGRPIPRGRVAPREALAFGLTLAVGSVLTLELIGNAVAAALLAFTIFFYVVVYTMWLKRSTPQNIVIGGISGALPPVIGWACVTGTVSWESLSLLLIIALWTPPHSWALALLKCEDYGRAGIPMMPVARGGQSTRWQMLAYSAVLLPAGLLPFFLGVGSLFYAAVAAGLGAIFLALTASVVAVRGDAQNPATVRRLFAFSLLYLAALFAVLLVERIVQAVGLWA